MLGSPSPIAYVETNWIVSAFYRHRTHHSAATRLLADARSGVVSLRIPYGCLLEAVHAIEAAGQEAMQVITKATEYVTNAQRNGEASLGNLAREMLAAPPFLAVDPKPHLDSLRNDVAIVWLASAIDELRHLDAVRTQVRFRGKDKFDLYILATVLADREKQPNAPAVFFSENKAEFEPRTPGPSFTASARPAAARLEQLPRMPDELYDNAKLVWRPDYDLTGALAEWKRRFP